MSDLLALASNDYGCCENGVDFATLLALIAGKTHQKLASNNSWRRKSKYSLVPI